MQQPKKLAAVPPAPPAPPDYLRLKSPEVPPFLENVLMVFANWIPEDARENLTVSTEPKTYPVDASETVKRNFRLRFVRERLEVIARLEYGLWLNGRLPFITPRELLLWRLRQYVEHIWAFELPEDKDLALIFNTTKLRASHVASASSRASGSHSSSRSHCGASIESSAAKTRSTGCCRLSTSTTKPTGRFSACRRAATSSTRTL